MDALSEIKEKLSLHDFFFDYSDDQSNWRRGFFEKAHILKLARKVPVAQIPELLELVPPELQKAWHEDLKVNVGREL